MTIKTTKQIAARGIIQLRKDRRKNIYIHGLNSKLLKNVTQCCSASRIKSIVKNATPTPTQYNVVPMLLFSTQMSTF